jgi:glucokinase
MILAGDIGGTKTFLGLFEPTATRPTEVRVKSFSSVEHLDLSAIIAAFLTSAGIDASTIDAACFGVAGPVLGRTATLTNLAWTIDADLVGRQFGIAHVDLLNDLQSMAYGVPVLHAAELHTLQEGTARPGGSMGLIAAGTGLGEALLHHIDGRFVPAPSEGGHADFAARNDREIALLGWLIARYGRAEIEAVVSGRGLLNIHRLVHAAPCPAVTDLEQADAAAAITTAAIARQCSQCVETLEMFVDAYGAEAGNVALRFVSTSGVFVGGGIAPKILPALTDGRFMRAFRSKAPFEPLLSAMPVKVILNPQTGLVGAAVYAAAFASSEPQP